MSLIRLPISEIHGRSRMAGTRNGWAWSLDERSAANHTHTVARWAGTAEGAVVIRPRVVAR
jgi:hypothetical protein